MYQHTEYKILERIYLNPGIHRGKLSKQLKLAPTAIDNGIKKLKKILIEEESGNQMKYYLDYKSKDLTAGLAVVEQNRVDRLPYKIRSAITEFLRLLDAKPIMAILFGSHAKGYATKDSDIDIFLVYSEKPNMKQIEKRKSQINMSTYLTLSPVYADYETFKKSFRDLNDKFYRELKEGKIILIGLEWWRLLESEKA